MPTPISPGSPQADNPTGRLLNRLARVTHRDGDIDLRVVAWRPDLADLKVYGQLAAHSYVQPAPSVCRVPVAGVRAAPDPAATQTTQLLLGETFYLLEISETWAWGYCGHDRYVGYVEAASLTEAAPPDAPPDALGEAPAPTHRVSAPQGLVFSGPSIKTALRLTMPLGARLKLTEHDDTFFALSDGSGFIHRRHVRLLDEWDTDPASVAESLLGTPYLWGGRTRSGIDCSGLVQAALMACGVECPRDSDQQQVVGHPVPEGEWNTLKRGDIVFFPGHVGIMADSTRLIHANAFWMNTVAEPLADVIARLKPETDTPVLCVRRLG